MYFLRSRGHSYTHTYTSKAFNSFSFFFRYIIVYTSTAYPTSTANRTAMLTTYVYNAAETPLILLPFHNTPCCNSPFHSHYFNPSPLNILPKFPFVVNHLKDNIYITFIIAVNKFGILSKQNPFDYVSFIK